MLIVFRAVVHMIRGFGAGFARRPQQTRIVEAS